MELDFGEKVELIIGRETDLGFNVVINGSLEGLLYKNEVFEPLERNTKKIGYIKKSLSKFNVIRCSTNFFVFIETN